MTRQNFYKVHRVRGRREIEESLVVELVKAERRIQPEIGTRKLLKLLREELMAAGVLIGRDRLFEVLAKHDLLVQRRRQGVRTTRSNHGFGVYENLLKMLAITRPHQVLVSDITYIRTDEGFMYLALVMDACSRAIVGWDCSDCLESLGAQRALGMALGQLPDGSETIHHSDRGCQYCCGEYVALLAKAQVRISMTEENHCYENAQAERLNGILKQEYGLGGTLRSKQQAKAMVRQAVELYNHRRPHQALGYEFPMRVHTAA
jgi:transposase InsO family protein